MEETQKQVKFVYPESLRGKIVAMENILKMEGVPRGRNPYTKIKDRMDAGLGLTKPMYAKVDCLSNVEFLAHYIP